MNIKEQREIIDAATVPPWTWEDERRFIAAAREEWPKALDLVEQIGEQMALLMPLDANDECFYCGLGCVPDSDGMHFDADNRWDGDQRCLKDSYYDDARAALAAWRSR